MADNKWTKEQQSAIDRRGCNLLVAAAAGAGKTAVLVERIIKKITDPDNPVDVDSLLIVTFTNAAATEMKERIGEAISKELEKQPDNKNIQRQQTLLNKADITTIHSFCLSVIRNNFQCLDIDPKFRILDETEAYLLKLETLNDLFDSLYEEENDSFTGNKENYFSLLESYGGNRDDLAIQDMVLEVHSFIQSSPWPEQWLDKAVEMFNIAVEDFGVTKWGSIIINSISMVLKSLATQLEDCLAQLVNAEGLTKYIDVFNDDLNMVNCIISACNKGMWDEVFSLVQGYSFSRLPTSAKNADENVKEKVKETREELKTYIKKLQEDVFYCKSEDMLNELNKLYPLLKCLSHLVLDFDRQYQERKKQKTAVDFNDLEHFCLKILTKEGKEKASDIAKNYRRKYSEIMVDEYQDSNDVQEIIIKTISSEDEGKPNVFMVGDVKQSIYRFRQAKPDLFMNKYRSYSPQEAPYSKIVLDKNFRSGREVVNSVNFIFRSIMSELAGELDYKNEEELRYGAEYYDIPSDKPTDGRQTEIYIMETRPTEELGNESATGSVGELSTTVGQSPTTATGSAGEQGAAVGKSNIDGAQELGTTVGQSPTTATGSVGEQGAADAADFDDENEEPLDNIQLEARMVAKRILELMSGDKEGNTFKVYDKKNKAYRNIEYRDIVILLRTTKNWSEIFLQELARYGIAAFADTGAGFFKTTEVQVMMSLLQIIDNPYQDIPLLSVLRSPIAGFSSDDLADLRLTTRSKHLYDALLALAEVDSEAGKKAAHIAAKLTKYREISHYMPTDRLLWHLYNDTGYMSIVGALPSGEKRQANLRMLFEKALQFETTSFKGLFNFINFIDKLKTSKGDMGSAKVLDDNDNFVRIMSIHKSKGLEFPVVFLSGCGKKFNMQDIYRSILLHQEIGFGPDIVDITRFKYASVAKLAIQMKVRTETLSEEMRILYVAMTRAREKLIITGSVRKLDSAKKKWLDMAKSDSNCKLEPYNMLKAQNYLDWICSALTRHEDCGELLGACSKFLGDSSKLLGDSSKLLGDCSFRDENSFIAGDETTDTNNDSLKSHWQVYFCKEGDLPCCSDDTQAQQSNSLEQWLMGSADDSSEYCRQEIDRRLSWEYSGSELSTIPPKFSVTELKRLFSTGEEDGEKLLERPVMKKPLFLQGKKQLSGAEKGSILHFVLQHLDFNDFDIKKQIDLMVQKNLLLQNQADSIRIDRIEKFMKSDLASRMRNAPVLNREIPFHLEIQCSSIPAYSHINDNEIILLQGVIDCYFEEDGEITLVDYKTDYVSEVNDELRDKYRLQLDYYAQALTRLTGKVVRQKYIYLFSIGEQLDI